MSRDKADPGRLQPAQRRLSPRRSIFGDVMHARLKPFGHRFSYRVMSLLIDLDRLDEADRLSALFGVNRAALYSFHEKDHGPRDGSSLRAFARTRRGRTRHRPCRRHGSGCSAIRGCSATPSIRSSVYFCTDASGELVADHLRGAQHASARCITTSCRSPMTNGELR